MQIIIFLPGYALSMRQPISERSSRLVTDLYPIPRNDVAVLRGLHFAFMILL